MSPEKLSPGAAARAARDADFAARFGDGAQPKPVVPKAEPAVQSRPYAAQEASKYEARFLKNLTNARDDFEWIKANEAWKTLGHESFTSWWETRVAPIMSALSMRPSRAVASEVVDRALADDAAVPEDRRRGTGKIAQLAGVDRKTVQRRTGAAMSHPAANETAAEGIGFPPRADGDEASFVGPKTSPAGSGAVFPGAGPGLPQTAAEGADPTEADGVQTFRGVSDDPNASEAAPAPDGGAASSPSGVTPDSPAAGTALPGEDTSYPVVSEPQQPGHNSPTRVEGRGSETDSSAGPDHPVVTTVLPGVDHQHLPAGEAPAVPSTAAVEPEELEGGDGTSTASPSSSDLDVPGNPAERLIFAVAGLVYYLDQLDVDAVGPLLDGPDVEQLFEHAEAISAHIERIGKARFAEMLHP